MPAIVETAPARLLRGHDRDRYLLSVFAPAPRRAAIQAIYAFNYEIARIRDTVSEPVLGQIRLQWWRDGVDEAFGDGSVRRHEVLTPLADAIRHHGLSRDHFGRLIAARERDLAPDPPENLAALEAYAEESSAPLQLLALEALGGSGAEANRAARDAAIAYALTGLLRAAPHLKRMQRLPPILANEPRNVAARAQLHLDAARAVRGRMPRAALPALWPAVFAAADLARLRRVGFDPFAPPFSRFDPWRAWRLAAASWLGRY
jgi:NADH dehydrogenase [ubiquinone] 1 alpha subcomplex assembly factor 6